MRPFVGAFVVWVALVLVGPAAAFGAGSISGTVTAAASGAVIADVEVCAESTDEEDFECATTHGDGEYSIAGLAAGSYKVGFWPDGSTNYVRQFYNAKSTWLEAQAVVVTDGADTAAIDAALMEGGQIEGRVIDAVTKAGVGGIFACAESNDEIGTFRCAETNAGGFYVIRGLETDSYDVGFYPEEESSDYLFQYYDGKASWFEATPVVVTAGLSTTGINADMKRASRIAGTVADAASGAGIRSSLVCAIDVELLEIGNCAYTGSTGHYEIGALPIGTYKVWFSPDVPAWEEEDDYFQQYWNAKPTLAQATPIALGAAAAAGGIDARLTSRRASPPPIVPPVPPALLAPSGPPKKLHCRKGWRKVRAKGKTRCVKARHKHRRHR